MRVSIKKIWTEFIYPIFQFYLDCFFRYYAFWNLSITSISWLKCDTLRRWQIGKTEFFQSHCLLKNLSRFGLYWLLILTVRVSAQVPVSEAVQQIYRLRLKAEKLYDDNKYPLSKRYYQRALDLATRYELTDLAANLLVDLSSLEHLDGRYKKAASLCLTGLSLHRYKRPVADSTLFKLYSSLGEYYRQLEYVDSSAQYFGLADNILSRRERLRQEIPEYVIYHFSNQSMLHELVGRFSLSETLALQALRLAKQQGDPADISIVSSVVAGQFERLGKYQAAIRIRLDELANYPAQDRQRARMYSGIGQNAFNQHHLRQALLYLHRSAQLYATLRSPTSSQNDFKQVIAVHNNLGRCYTALQNYGKATDYFDKAIKLHLRFYGPKGRLLADSWLMKGKINQFVSRPLDAFTDWTRALEAVTASSTAFDSTGNPNVNQVLDAKKALEILLAKGELLYKLQQWKQSLQANRRAIELFQLTRKQLYLLDDKLYLNETVQPLYQQALASAYQVYRDTRTQSAFDLALTIVEQGRAMALQDFFTESTLRPQYIPEQEIYYEQHLRQQLSLERSKLLDNLSQQDRTIAESRQRSIQFQHYRLLHHWERTYPAYSRAHNNQQPLAPQTIQSALDRQKAYICFGYTSGRLHLFAVTREKTVWKTMEVDSCQLFRTMRALKDTLSTHPGLRKYQGTPLAIQIYEWYIVPLLPTIQAKQEWIINAGLLDGIPIDALETGNSINDYLTLHYTIRYVYSPSVLLQPPFSNQVEPRALAIAPFTHDLPPSVRSRFKYRTLTETADEINGVDAERLIDTNATRTKFNKVSPKYSLWYFSTHAYLNKSEYARSFLALYPNDRTLSHRLYVDEINQMDLHHLRMVILSICDAGGGRLYSSEGIMSLARAFAYAGCPVTINTVWNAQERSSVLLMKQFLAYLQQGNSPALSLQKARQDFFISPEGKAYNHPYFWANFMVVGENVPLYQPSFFEQWSKTLGFRIGVSLCVVLLLTSLLYSHFRR